jgi:hypothetical protein
MSENRMLHTMQRDRSGNTDGRHDGVGNPYSTGGVRLAGRLVLALSTTLLVLGWLVDTANAQQLLRAIPGVPALPSNDRAGDRSSSSQRPPAPPPGQFAPAPNTGPVTGYGPGGIGQLPGTPINPPYH